MESITLRAARVNAGLTAKAAAERLGITVDTLSSWERGMTFPNVPQIQQIEGLYGVPYHQLNFLPRDNG